MNELREKFLELHQEANFLLHSAASVPANNTNTSSNSNSVNATGLLPLSQPLNLSTSTAIQTMVVDPPMSMGGTQLSTGANSYAINHIFNGLQGTTPKEAAASSGLAMIPPSVCIKASPITPPIATATGCCEPNAGPAPADPPKAAEPNGSLLSPGAKKTRGPYKKRKKAQDGDGLNDVANEEGTTTSTTPRPPVKRRKRKTEADKLLSPKEEVLDSSFETTCSIVSAEVMKDFEALTCEMVVDGFAFQSFATFNDMEDWVKWKTEIPVKVEPIARKPRTPRKPRKPKAKKAEEQASEMDCSNPVVKSPDCAGTDTDASKVTWKNLDGKVEEEKRPVVVDSDVEEEGSLVIVENCSNETGENTDDKLNTSMPNLSENSVGSFPPNESALLCDENGPDTSPPPLKVAKHEGDKALLLAQSSCGTNLPKGHVEPTHTSTPLKKNSQRQSSPSSKPVNFASLLDKPLVSNAKLSSHQKKRGKWCAMHVRLAYLIYQHQQQEGKRAATEKPQTTTIESNSNGQCQDQRQNVSQKRLSGHQTDTSHFNGRISSESLSHRNHQEQPPGQHKLSIPPPSNLSMLSAAAAAAITAPNTSYAQISQPPVDGLSLRQAQLQNHSNSQLAHSQQAHSHQPHRQQNGVAAIGDPKPPTHSGLQQYRPSAHQQLVSKASRGGPTPTSGTPTPHHAAKRSLTPSIPATSRNGSHQQVLKNSHHNPGGNLTNGIARTPSGAVPQAGSNIFPTPQQAAATAELKQQQATLDLYRSMLMNQQSLLSGGSAVPTTVAQQTIAEKYFAATLQAQQKQLQQQQQNAAAVAAAAGGQPSVLPYLSATNLAVLNSLRSATGGGTPASNLLGSGGAPVTSLYDGQLMAEYLKGVQQAQAQVAGLMQPPNSNMTPNGLLTAAKSTTQSQSYNRTSLANTGQQQSQMGQVHQSGHLGFNPLLQTASPITSNMYSFMGAGGTNPTFQAFPNGSPVSSPYLSQNALMAASALGLLNSPDLLGSPFAASAQLGHLARQKAEALAGRNTGGVGSGSRASQT